MNTAGDHLALDKVARITGGLYLAYILASVLATMLGQIGLGTPPQVYQAIVTNEGSFRLGLVVALITGFLFLMVAWGLYVLLRRVNKNLALLFLLLNAVGVAIQGASMLGLVSALLQGDAASHMQAFSAAQLEGLAYLSIGVYKTGWVTAQLFFGTWLFPLGYLVYKSGLLPRFLGVLLVLDGIAVLVWFLQALLLPDYPAIHYPGLVLSFLAELGLALWLLVKGVKVVDAGAGLPAREAATRIRRPRALGHEGRRLHAVRSTGGPPARGARDPGSPEERGAHPHPGDRRDVERLLRPGAEPEPRLPDHGAPRTRLERAQATRARHGALRGGGRGRAGRQRRSKWASGYSASIRHRFGTYAEYVCWPEDGLLATRPANLSDEEAAAIPYGGLLALHVLRKAGVRAGQRVLVYGASGAVGTSAVQLARHLGAEVTGVCSTANVDLVASLGATTVVDYTREDFTDGAERYDLILDAVGKRKSAAALRRCRQVLAPGGAFVSVDDGTPNLRLDDLVLLGELATKGEIRPVIDRTYALDNIAEAHRYVDNGHKRGNVVIAVT